MKKLLALTVSFALAGVALAGRPVARWDVVPFQRVEGPFKLGVVAFHEKGVKVEFSVNGKKVWIAKKAIRNDRTGLFEHIFPFDASKYKDGPVTLSATAITKGEEPYKLEDLVLYADSGKTQGSRNVVWVDGVKGNDYAKGTKDDPVRSFKRGVAVAGDGGTVYLCPGVYPLKMLGGGTSRKFWTRVMPAPGSDDGAVEVCGGRPGTDKLKFENLKLTCDAGPGDIRPIVAGESSVISVWFDNCTLSNVKGRYVGVSKPFGNGVRGFVTGGVTRDMTYGPRCEFVRGHEVRSIAGEAFTGGDCLIANVKVSDIDPSGCNIDESDLYQGFARPPRWIENAILYNVVATDCKCCAIMSRQVRHSAFVNISFEGVSETRCQTKFSEGLENVIFARVVLNGQSWWWVKTDAGRDDVKPVDVRLFGVKAQSFHGYDDDKGIRATDDCDIICFPKGVK